MDEREFETLAERTLRDLQAALEDALGDEAEVDLRGGILTVEFDDGRQFVLNKHTPNRQLWLSSPVSGAAHFNPAGSGAWLATRRGGALNAILAADLSQALGRPVALD
jgi:frataxin